jgi:hypothetical protein
MLTLVAHESRNHRCRAPVETGVRAVAAADERTERHAPRAPERVSACLDA